MSRSPMYDPQTSEARSPWLAGLTEICNKLSGVLNMDTDTFVNLPLPEVYISEEDRYRIYQAPLGNKLWLQNPVPVIKKNGVVITPETDGFEIDYLGGSIVFNEEYTLTASDVVSASATYIVDKSAVITAINKKIDDIASISGSFKGSFYTPEDLRAIEGTGELGDFAIVQSEDTIYIWNDSKEDWMDIHKAVDLTNYYNMEQVDALLELKEDDIAEKGNTAADDMYYFGGRKTWVSLADKILDVALTGLVTTDKTSLQETDTFIEAFGKLQAQINESGRPMSGMNEPTVDTVGSIGQDYVDLSNGDKYHLTTIEDEGTGLQYVWEQYADVSSIKSYVDKSIQTAVLSAWHKDY